MVCAALVFSALTPFIRPTEYINGYYVSFVSDSYGPITPKALEEYGAKLKFSEFDNFRLFMHLSYKTPRRYSEPWNLRAMLIDKRGVITYIDRNGNVTVNNTSWKLEPAAFLRLFLLLEDKAKGAAQSP